MSIKQTVMYRFWVLLTRKERVKFITIIFTNVINSLLDIFSIGAIFTVVAVLLIPEKLEKYNTVNHFFDLLPQDESQRFYVIIIITIIFYVFKTFAFRVIKTFEYRANYAVRNRIFTDVLQQYLNKNFLFHLNRSVEQSIKTMIQLPNSFSGYVIIPIFITITNFIGLIILLPGLIYFDPLNFSLMFMYIGVSAYFYYRFNTRNLKKKQLVSEIAQNKATKVVMESLSCIKDLKMTYSEYRFLKTYKESVELSNKVSGQIDIANAIPRYFLELFVVSGVLVLILYKHIIGEDLKLFFVQLSVLGVATSRLLPYVTSLNSALTRFKSSQIILDEVFKNYDISLPPLIFSKGVLTPPKFQEKIEVTNLSYSYPTKNKKSLDAVSLSICLGERIAFVGASGGGKTTLINILVGLIEQDDGNIFLDGVPIKAVPNYRLLFGYIPQDIVLLDTTIKENIAFGIPPESIDETQVNLVLEQVELADFVKEQPEGIETVVGERGIKISGGQRQRIGIARALYRNPSVLVMDEATAALDNITERKIIKTLSKIKDKTFITIAHRLSTVENSDRIYLIDEGHLVDEGDFQTLAKNSKIFKKMLSADE